MDIWILNWLQQFTNEFLDVFFKGYTRLSDYGEIWIFICVVFLFFKKYRRAGFMGLVALLVEAVLITLILKPIFDRPRPYITYNVDILIPKPLGTSFPSGHAAASFSVAFMLYFNKVPFRKTIMFMAALMAYSRLYLYVHYPSDILFGIFVALAIAILLKIYQDAIIRFVKRIYFKIKV